jgi:hypothetical protein
MIRTLEQELSGLESVFNALGTLSLKGYADQKTNTNCMEELQKIYNNLNAVNETLKEYNAEEEGKTE